MDIKIQLDNLTKPLKELSLEVSAQNYSLFQSYCHQFTLSIIEYLFLGSSCTCQLTSLEFKSVLIQYISQLRKYYENNKESAQCQIVNKLIKIRLEHFDKEQEGFIDSEDDEIRVVRQISFQKSTQDYSNDAGYDKYKQILETKDNEINILKAKLQVKEQKLLDLASGYLKDLQNLREQMYKKSDDFDYYEVSYCDVTDIEDPKYRDLVNSKISNLKSQYEKKTREIYIFVQKQKTEIQNLRQNVSQYEQKIKSMDNVEYLMNRIFSLEPDPYKIWKNIQDIKGNVYFKDVFEKQKPASGIKYREINKLLMVTKAYDRELEYYKKGIEDQMVVYLERACGIINLQNQDQLDEIERLQREVDKLKGFEARIFQQVQNQFTQFKQTLKRNQEQYMEIKSKELSQLQKMQMKYATKLWYFISQMKKGKDVKEMILHAYQNDYEKLTSQQFTELESNYLKSVVQSKVKQEEIDELNKQIKEMETENDELKVINASLKVQIEEQKAKAKNHQKCLQLIVRHIDSKITPEQLNLEDNSRETSQTFKERLKQLRKQHNGLKYIQEVQEQYDKNQQAMDFISMNFEDKSTQTMIQDVNKSLAEAIEICELEQSKDNIEFTKQMSKKMQDAECQSDFLNVDELHKQITYLKQHIKHLSQDIDDMEGEIQVPNKFLPIYQRNLSNDLNSSQKSGALKRRYVQVNESKDSNSNCHDDPVMVSSDKNNFQVGQTNQLIILHPNQSVERIAQTQQIFDSKTQRKGVFNRLFEDSKKKSQRIEQIKYNLEVLEKEHWQQVAELAKEDQDIICIFKDGLQSSKHFYQKQLQRNFEIEQKYFPFKHNRAQFYFKKFKDFHIHQQEMSEILFDPHSSDEKTQELQRLNIKSVVQDRKLYGKVKFNGLKRDEYLFFKELERKKLKSRTFRSTYQSPKQKKIQYISFKNPFIGSEASYDMSEYNQSQITKHLQKAYDLGQL